MERQWPTKTELEQLQAKENRTAKEHDEPADPICECGEPGWSCQCEEIAKELGHWADGSVYIY